ncbi:hypothetical protein DYU11_17295 [Fibrisoma montanum]|uniref:Uncharacterized protein n=1 Tax=Fibrisoma montanum TaxID=2305895 RepID=A0A418M5R1_9BACT|nr:hypothetical protein [Fibrisoma montanum]RIV21181.1 hypothetical protein DYU11_17295 [Fibrisoma montanum]
MKILAIILSLFTALGCSRSPDDKFTNESKVNENYISIEKLVTQPQPETFTIEFIKVDEVDELQNLIYGETVVSCLNTEVKMDKPYVIAKGVPFHVSSWKGHVYNGTTKVMKIYFL